MSFAGDGTTDIDMNNEDMSRLLGAEMVQEQADTEAYADDFAASFDQDFAVMSLQLNQLIEELIEAAGGANQ